jgi:hypothetical protein
MHCWLVPVFRYKGEPYVITRGVQFNVNFGNGVREAIDFSFTHVPSSKFRFDPSNPPDKRTTLERLKPILAKEWGPLAKGPFVRIDQDFTGELGGIHSNRIESVTRILIDLGHLSRFPYLKLHRFNHFKYPRHPVFAQRLSDLWSVASEMRDPARRKHGSLIFRGSAYLKMETKGFNRGIPRTVVAENIAAQRDVFEPALKHFRRSPKRMPHPPQPCARPSIRSAGMINSNIRNRRAGPARRPGFS